MPFAFNMGVIVRILKTATLDPNDPANYRPITPSSICAKFGELICCLRTAINISDSKDNVNDNQYGFRKRRKYFYVLCLLNLYFNNMNYPVFVCSLDADNI